jgi:hypothetical protein
MRLTAGLLWEYPVGMKHYKTLSTLSNIWVFFGVLNLTIAILYLFGAVGYIFSSMWASPAGRFSVMPSQRELISNLILGACFFGGGLVTLTIAHLIKLAINVADCLHRATEPEITPRQTTFSDEPVPPI